MKRVRRRTVSPPLMFGLGLLLFAAGVSAGYTYDREEAGEVPAPQPVIAAFRPAALQTPAPPPDKPSAAPERDSWELVLVNFEVSLPDSYAPPQLTRLRSGQTVDSRIYPALQSMMDGARAAGLQPVVCSAYRPWETQQELFNAKVQEYLAQGCIQQDAEEQAAMWVARPGASEHQTGMAVDIVDLTYQILDEGQERTPVQQWLIAHCAEYGFILRYPTNKSAITGVSYEPWHYRYVGVDAAREMMENGLCLEEYLA